MKRIPSGITGLDRLLGGGLPESGTVLLSGPAGAGKTIFGLQFLCNSKESGMFASFEEEVGGLRETASSFGWDIEKMERGGRVSLMKYDPYKFDDVMEVMENNLRETGAKRLVIDSISALGMYINNPPELRRVMLHIGLVMRNHGCLAVIISEMYHSSLSRFGVEEFVCDGVIALDRQVSGDEYKRHISVLKLRSSDHSRLVHNYSITKDGIIVK